MRDPNRIDNILQQLAEIWKWGKNPELRLGQLLLNALGDPALYYIEDQALIDYLKNYYRIEKEED